MKHSVIALTAGAALLLSACSSQEEAKPAESPSTAVASAEASEATTEASESPSEAATSEAPVSDAAAGDMVLAMPEVEGFTPMQIEQPKRLVFTAPSGCLAATGVDEAPPFEGTTDRAATEHALSHVGEAFGSGSVVSAEPIQEVKLADGTQMMLLSLVLEKDGEQAPMVTALRIDVESGKAIHFLGACQDRSPVDLAEMQKFISSLRLESGNPGEF